MPILPGGWYDTGLKQVTGSGVPMSPMTQQEGFSMVPFLPLIGAGVQGIFGIGQTYMQSQIQQQQAKVLQAQQREQARQLAQELASQAAQRQAVANLQYSGQAFTAEQIMAEQAFGASKTRRTQQMIGLVLVGAAAIGIAWYVMRQRKS
jgi:histidyl-tRNA synthetase